MRLSAGLSLSCRGVIMANYVLLAASVANPLFQKAKKIAKKSLKKPKAWPGAADIKDECEVTGCPSKSMTQTLAKPGSF